MQAAPTLGISPSEKRTLDIVTDHPMIPREHLARWLGVSEGRVSQMMHSLVSTWSLVERRGQRGNTCYTLSAEGIRYVTHRDRAQLPTTQGIWSTAITTDRQGRRRHMGHRIDTWARQTRHADGITWFLSKLEAEARDNPDSELLWSVPTARSDRAYNWGDSAIAPDAVGKVIAGGLHVPFYLEYELRARHPRGVIARLSPYTSYYCSTEPGEDQPPFPITLFVVDTEDVEATYVRTSARMTRMSLPILVSCRPALSNTGILGQSWRPLWEPESPRLGLSEMRAYQWDSLYHRMRHRPVGGIGPMRPYPPTCCLGAESYVRRAAFRGSPTPQTALSAPVLATQRAERPVDRSALEDANDWEAVLNYDASSTTTCLHSCSR